MTGANELTPELEREERVPRCRLLYARQLGSGQLEPEPLLEQPMERTDAQRPQLELREPFLGKRALELGRHRDARRSAKRRE